MVLKRGGLTLINIFFPPLGVALLCGMDADLFINCMLFLCAIIPSHVHAFYISCTYFSRKRKVRKGIWPGERRAGIFCERVQRGGAGRRECEELRLDALMQKEDKTLGRVNTKASRKSGRAPGRDSRFATPTSPQSMQSGKWSGSSGVDGQYGSPQPQVQSPASNRMSRASTRYSGYEPVEMRDHGRRDGLYDERASRRRSQRVPQ